MHPLRPRHLVVVLCVAAAFALLWAGCERRSDAGAPADGSRAGEEQPPAPSASTESPTTVRFLSDAAASGGPARMGPPSPATEVDALLVRIAEVKLRRKDAPDDATAWIALTPTDAVVDLLQLGTGDGVAIASGRIPGGTVIDETRIRFAGDPVALVDGEERGVNAPSATAEAGFRVKGEYSIATGGDCTSIPIRIDVAGSLTEQSAHGYRLDPVTRDITVIDAATCSGAVQETIHLDPPRTLGEVLTFFDAEMLLHEATIRDGSERQAVLVLVPPTRVPEEVLAQYESAYESTNALVQQLLRSGTHRDPAGVAATEEELSALSDLRAAPRTTENMMLAAVRVSGPDESVRAFRAALED